MKKKLFKEIVSFTLGSMLLALCFLLYAQSSLLYAEVQTKLNYQGKLKENGVAVTAVKKMEFKIFDLKTNGTIIWESAPQNVSVKDGLFNYPLGGDESFSDIDWGNGPYFLEVVIEGVTLMPREEIMGVAYSLYAKTVSDEAITTTKIADNSVTSSKMSEELKTGAVGWGLVPSGAIMLWSTGVVPEGWLECKGQQLTKSTYPALFNAIQYCYGGSGDIFKLPDFRGYFVRGWDHEAGRDPSPDRENRANRGDGTTGDNVGTIQLDEFKSHSHSEHGVNACYAPADSGSQSGHGITTATAEAGGSETRPKNIYMMYIIKK
jgi:microcystin-dependent protein